MKFSTPQAALAVGVTRVAIDKKITRGEIQTRHAPGPGKPREWDIDEILRLGVAVAISEARNGASFSESFSRFALDNYSADLRNSFLVIFEQSPSKVQSKAALAAIEKGEADVSGTWTCEIVKASDLVKFITGSRKGVIVIDLDGAISPVREKLAAML